MHSDDANPCKNCTKQAPGAAPFCDLYCQSVHQMTEKERVGLARALRDRKSA
jgi:hypothetical protein